MAFTKEQKRIWRKSPHVKQRQKEHARNHFQLMAAAHGVSPKVYANSGCTQSDDSLIRYIREYELRQIKRKLRPTTGYRNKHPLLRSTCHSCGSQSYSYLSRTAGKWCKRCRPLESNRERSARGRCISPTARSKKNARERSQYQNSEAHRLNKQIAACVRTTRGKNHWLKLGYTHEQYVAYIESQLPSGATYDDVVGVGKKFRVEKKLPVRTNMTKAQVYEAWQFDNLKVVEVIVAKVRDSLGIQRSPKVTTCAVCGKDIISPLGRKSCEKWSCSHKHARGRTLEQDQSRACVDCGLSLAGTHGKRKRCVACASKAK